MTTYNGMATQLQDSVLLDITGDASPDTKKLMVEWVGAARHGARSVATVPRTGLGPRCYSRSPTSTCTSLPAEARPHCPWTLVVRDATATKKHCNSM